MERVGREHGLWPYRIILRVWNLLVRKREGLRERDEREREVSSPVTCQWESTVPSNQTY